MLISVPEVYGFYEVDRICCYLLYNNCVWSASRELILSVFLGILKLTDIYFSLHCHTSLTVLRINYSETSIKDTVIFISYGHIFTHVSSLSRVFNIPCL